MRQRDKVDVCFVVVSSNSCLRQPRPEEHLNCWDNSRGQHAQQTAATARWRASRSVGQGSYLQHPQQARQRSGSQGLTLRLTGQKCRKMRKAEDTESLCLKCQRQHSRSIDLSTVDVRNISDLMKTWLRELPPIISLQGECMTKAHQR